MTQSRREPHPRNTPPVFFLTWHTDLGGDRLDLPVVKVFSSRGCNVTAMRWTSWP